MAALLYSHTRKRMQMDIEEIARVCHEANAGLCRAFGDTSQVSWGEAPEWQKQSACNGVKFHLDNPDAGPSGSHSNWLREKLADGWKYGPEKNVEAKEHPCCVTYDALPASQQAKDYVFTAIVKALAE